MNFQEVVFFHATEVTDIKTRTQKLTNGSREFQVASFSIVGGSFSGVEIAPGVDVRLRWSGWVVCRFSYESMIINAKGNSFSVGLVKPVLIVGFIPEKLVEYQSFDYSKMFGPSSK